MTELISLATATAHPGRLDDLVRELQARTGPTGAQPGNLEFTLYREAGAPDTIVAYERWASRADRERHLQGEHVTALMAAFKIILAAPPQIWVLTPVADQAAASSSPASVVRAYLGAWQDRDFPAMRRLVQRDRPGDRAAVPGEWRPPGHHGPRQPGRAHYRGRTPPGGRPGPSNWSP